MTVTMAALIVGSGWCAATGIRACPSADRMRTVAASAVAIARVFGDKLDDALDRISALAADPSQQPGSPGLDHDAVNRLRCSAEK